MARRKQKPDLRRIRVSQSYTVTEAADMLDRKTATVRDWIKRGLPVLPDTSPRLICGNDLKTWLDARWKSRKQPCEVDQLYCCKCRRPRHPLPDSVATSPLSAKTVTVLGKCSLCGTAMQQPRSFKNLAETLTAMKAPTQAHEHLTSYTNTSERPTFFLDADDANSEPQNKGKRYVH